MIWKLHSSRTFRYSRFVATCLINSKPNEIDGRCVRILEPIITKTIFRTLQNQIPRYITINKRNWVIFFLHQKHEGCFWQPLFVTRYVSIYHRIIFIEKVGKLSSIRYDARLRYKHNADKRVLPSQFIACSLNPNQEPSLWSSTDKSMIMLKIANVNPLNTERNLFYMRTQCVPRCKHSPLRL
jgi:hypothetical protein